MRYLYYVNIIFNFRMFVLNKNIFCFAAKRNAICVGVLKFFIKLSFMYVLAEIVY